MNPERETHKAHNKKINKKIDDFKTWFNSVHGSNVDKAIEFMNTYMCHLNDLTKKSFFEHLLDITETRVLDINKQNDLTILIEELYKLLQEFRTL